MIFLNPFLDSLCNFGFKNIGLTTGTGLVCFQSSQDIVVAVKQPTQIIIQLNSSLQQINVTNVFWSGDNLTLIFAFVAFGYIIDN